MVRQQVEAAFPGNPYELTDAGVVVGPGPGLADALAFDLSSEADSGIAATPGAWHVLAYDATDRGLAVRIYSAPHGDLVFHPSHELATRAFGFGDVYPVGQMRLLAGIEALTGLLMISWTASFTYLEMGRHWGVDRRS